MSQTGGGCRATNYIGFIRKALRDAGYPNVPVISFNVVGLEKNDGFKFDIKLLEVLLKCIMLGDLLQKVTFRNRAYEVHKGDTKKMYDKWMEKCKDIMRKGTYKEFKKTVHELVEDFETIEVDFSEEKPRVGIVGEVLIKYHPYGNNHIVEKLEEEGAEVINPDFMGFLKFICTHKITNNMLLNRDRKLSSVFRIVIKLMDIIERPINKALAESKKGYMKTPDIWELEKKVKDILSIGNQTGEGWFLTSEMCEYIEHGIPNIVCVQPFACLPNHVVGKGVIKTIRSKYPEANISPIDYDPGASETNQFNRIKLMMAQAKDNLKK
jgi:predicted nucleotide-binding protein (sugar kinase/HSP70/actin superfamily)